MTKSKKATSKKAEAPEQQASAEHGYRIRDDVPMPEGRGGTKYPFGELAVGQCLEIPDKEPSQVRGNAYAYGQRHRKVLRTYKNPDGPGCVVFRRPDEEFVPRKPRDKGADKAAQAE